MARIPNADVDGLVAAVAALQQLDAAALRRRWRALVGGPMPADLGRPLILRVLAYKLQAERLGDLDRASLRELAGLAGSKSDAGPSGSFDHLGMSIAEEGGKPGRAARPAGSAHRIVRPGTLLVREHAGILHRVMILEEGVTWNGRTYDSLSQVAFAITGTKWNGPRFFGLRDKGEEAAKNHGKPKASIEAKTQGRSVIGRGRGRVAQRGHSSPQRVSP